jgi:hypothetical protein
MGAELAGVVPINVTPFERLGLSQRLAPGAH